MRPAPNLSDPAARSAYRAELRGVARGVRFAGLGLAALALVLSFMLPSMPQLPKWLPMVPILPAALLMIAATVLRTRYHLRRMRGEG